MIEFTQDPRCTAPTRADVAAVLTRHYASEADVRLVQKALSAHARSGLLPAPETLARYAAALSDARDTGELVVFLLVQFHQSRPEQDDDGTARLGERDERHDAARRHRQGGPAGD